MRRRLMCVWTVVGLALGLGAARVFAGQAASAASIIGQVTDESGGILPGVTVTATSPALQVPSVVSVTDEQGEYRLTPLPIGVYTVVYDLQGFQTVRRQEIRLTTGFVARLDIKLGVGSLEESITVSGAAPVVDTTSTTTTTSFTRETLEVLPTNRNGINSLMVQAPGARGTLEAGGNISFSPPGVRTFGQGAEPWYTFEGVYTPSPQSSGGLGNYWDYNSLEEAAIQTLGTNAEVGGRGIFISAAVKSGGNDRSGSATWAYMNSNLQGSNIDDALRAQGITAGDRIRGRYDLSGDFGGSIVRDKLWFYTAVRDRQNNFESINAFMPDGTLAKNFQNQRANVTGKLSYQMNSANKFIVYASHSRRAQESINQFTAWESRTDSPLWTTVAKAEWQTVRGNALVASVQWGRWGYVSPPRATSARGDWSQGPSIFDEFTRRVSGANTSVGRSWDYHRHHPRAVVSYYKADWLGGNHDFRGGVDVFYDYGTSPRAEREGPNYRLVFNNAVPLQIETHNSPVTPLQKQYDVAGYLQDSWTIRRRLTLNLGLRYNYENSFIPASCRQTAKAPADTLFPAACFDKIRFRTLNQWMPRLRAAFDVAGDGRTLIKGGWGRYYYRRIIEGDIDYADPNTFVTASFRWRDPNRNRDYDTGEVNWDPNGPDFINISGGVNSIPNPNERVPKDDEWSLTIERQLGLTTGVRLTALYSRRTDPYRLTNLLRPAAAYNIPVTRVDPGPDGRPGTLDDPGTSITYYEFAPALAGRKNELFMRINDPAGTQTYKGLDLQFNRRLANRWMLTAGYSATKSDNPYLPGLNIAEFSSTSRGADTNPNAEINTANRTWEWLVHVTGSYLLPGEVTVSAVYEHRSGIPWARQVLFSGGVLGSIVLNVEPIGTRRLPNINSVDLRVEKALSLGNRKRLKLRVNIYNLINANTVTGVTQRAGAAFNRASGILSPRIAEVGFAFVF
jgi:hypothetical protein